MDFATPARGIFLCILLVCTGAACGGPEVPRPTHPEASDQTWHTEPPRRRTNKEFVPIRLPDARHAQLETRRDPDVPLLVLNFLPDGGIYFKGMTWDVSEDADARTHAYASLQREMIEVHRDPSWRDETGRSRMPVSLLGDRATSWANLADAIALLDAPKLRTQFVRFPVLRWSTPHRDMCIAGDLRPLSDRTPNTVVTVEQVREGGASQTKLVLQVGDQEYSFRFPPSAGLEVLRHPTDEDSRWLVHANMVWDKIRKLLAEQTELGAHAAVRVPRPKDVEFGYVLTSIDLLLGRGIRDIDFPDQQFTIGFGEHADKDPPEPSPARR